MNNFVSALFDVVTSLKRGQKAFILMSIDVVLVPISLVLASIVSGGTIGMAYATAPTLFMLLALVMAVSAAAFSWFLGLPRIKLNAYEQNGIQRTACYAALVGGVGLLGLAILFDGSAALRSMVVFTMILTILSVTTRIIARNILISLYQRGQVRQRVLIYGAGQTGVQLASALQTDDAVMPMAFVDDNKTLHNLTVAGLQVFSPVHIKALIEEYAIDRVVLAMPSNSRPKQARLARRLQEFGCEVSTLPSFATLVGEGKLVDRIQPVDPSDFLGRSGVSCGLEGLCDIYAGRTVMITGAGGSIGSELTRQILACQPSRIVLFESSEHALYQIDLELNDLGLDWEKIDIVPMLGSVTDADAVRRAISDHKVDIILHAAAYKHVPLVERNRLAGLRNNVIGTKVVAEAARDAQVSHFILISTDKAVHPTNTMGASKRLAEMFIQNLSAKCPTTRFGIVRFGNVLGSSGSVVPLFEEQIARGGPVTLTHEEVTRYFMTLAEAARLVLLSGSFSSINMGGDAENGQVFVLDMGDPVPIQNLARQMIEAAGYTVCDDKNPTGDIEIVITGLRPGEKIHEELAIRGHAMHKTSHPKILRIEEKGLSELEVATAMRDLTRAIDSRDVEAACEVMSRWAPCYQHERAGHYTPARRPNDNVRKLEV